MPWARASALDRHLLCPAASHLPMADRGAWWPGYMSDGTVPLGLPEPDDRDASAAEWGTAMHAAKAGVGQDPWNMWMDPHRDRLWPARLGQHEISVSYDCESGEIDLFGSPDEDARTRWKLAKPRQCVVGTSDWWAELPTGEPWIDDLKTGWRRPEVLTPANLFYLMCRVKVANAGSPRPWLTGRASITWCPRQTVKDGDEIPVPTREGLWRQVTRPVLDAFELDLRAAWERVKMERGARPGAHCMYCPSAQVCPESNR